MRFISNSLFYKELKIFLKTNWWIFVIFFVCLFIIFYTNKGNVFEILLVFILHFLGDLLVMMMWAYHVQKNIKKAAIAQLWSYIIFGLIWLYALFFFWKWEYIIPQISFLLPNLKWFIKDILWKDLKFLNWQLSLIVWIFVFWIYYFFNLIWNFWQFVQVLWFVIFPLALMINTRNIRYFLSLLGIFFITFGSAYVFVISFIHWNVTWVDISYTILPFTVFIFFLKDFPKYVK